MAEYLQYWKYIYNAEQLAALDGATHTAGNTLARIRPGDTVWIVTLLDDRLYLVGRIPVGWVGSKQDAERKLRETDLWDAKYHAIARRGEAEQLRMIDIGSIAKDLRFLGGVDRLPVAFSGQSLQTLRTLSPQSVEVLDRVWNRATSRSGPRGSKQVSGTAFEGAMTEVRRYARGRSRRLRDEAMAKAGGICACCARDFSQLLNGFGVRVLQVHHKKQLAATDVPRLTSARDLAVVCANCHALVHMEPGRALPVERLKRMLMKNGSF